MLFEKIIIVLKDNIVILTGPSSNLWEDVMVILQYIYFIP